MIDETGMIELGPLAPLAGVWEGDQGIDDAPSVSRGRRETAYRERIVFEPLEPIENHEQKLYGLRYSTTATPHGEDAKFSGARAPFRTQGWDRRPR